MPRLPNHHYLALHHWLRDIWLNHQHVYSWLLPAEQWQLHDFFQPCKAMTDAELLDHRKQISDDRPSLPQQAGRALAKLDDILQTGQLTPPTRSGRITVRSIVQPEIDPQAFVQLLIEISKEWAQPEPPTRRESPDKWGSDVEDHGKAA